MPARRSEARLPSQCRARSRIRRTPLPPRRRTSLPKGVSLSSCYQPLHQTVRVSAAIHVPLRISGRRMYQLRSQRAPDVLPGSLEGRSAARHRREFSETLHELAELAANFFVDQVARSEEHTSELQSLRHLVCRLLLEKKQ